MSYSFYIPRVASRYNEDTVKAVFQSQCMIGSVNRVDFVPIEGNTKFQTAFVHMSSINSSDITDKIITKVFCDGESIRIYPDVINTNVYWILLANKNPVSETKLNIHQLAENANILQALVFKQVEQIARLQETVCNLTARIFDENCEKSTIYAYSNFVKHVTYYENGHLPDEWSCDNKVESNV